MERVRQETVLHDRKELLKYKAVAEYERCSRLEQGARLTDRLDQYAFDPAQVTYATTAGKCLEQMGADLEAQAFRRFDFEGYGKELYAQTGRKLTAYGAVSKEPVLEEVQSEDHAMMTQGMDRGGEEVSIVLYPGWEAKRRYGTRCMNCPRPVLNAILRYSEAEAGCCSGDRRIRR